MPDETANKPGAFVWPPRPAVEVQPAQSTAVSSGPAAPIQTKVRSRRGKPRVGDQIERSFLGVQTSSITARAIERGWRPDAAGEYCPACGLDMSSGVECERCRDAPPPWDRLVRLGAYDGFLGEWIREVKFDASSHAGARLGEAMGRALAKRIATWPGVLAGTVDRVVLVPVPTTWRRRVARKIDHTLTLCRGMRRALRGELAHAVSGQPPPVVSIARLLRKRHGPSQLKVAPSERQANASRAYRSVEPPGWLMWTWPRLARFAASSLGPWSRVSNGRTLVILVDDIITTGATLAACSREVRRGLARRKWTVAGTWICVAAATQFRQGERGHPDDV